jgi:1,5-anhydro-D-fructose reductase (1,5-anhydro-D-mannitol-forming)
MPNVVRAAMVGVGGFTRDWVVPAARNLPNLRYVAVCDVRPDVAAWAAQALGAETVTARYEEVLARPDVDLVDLQTPNFLHAAQAEAAFAAGKHVFCQKPMAAGIPEAKRMIRAARKAGRLLGVFMDDLNGPLVHDMKRAVQAGLIGRPTAFHIIYGRPGWRDLSADAWRRSARKTGGGCFILLTIHYVRLIAWLLDTRVRRATGFVKTLLADMEGEDSAAGALELENGLVGTAASSYIITPCPEVPGTMVILYGTGGAMQFNREGRSLTVFSTAGTFEGEVVRYAAPGRAQPFTCPAGALHRPTVHEQFADAILSGRPFEVPGEAGLHDLAVCQALAESSRSGRAVDLVKFIGDVP